MGNLKSKPSEALKSALAASLERYAGAGQRITVALSGGVDSVVLLHALRAEAMARAIPLAALHVHHGLGPNADDWETHCRDLCAQWALPLTVARVEVERGSRDGLEAAARRARRAIFDATGGDWIALAHHRDDQAETMLFNLLRGTGLRGAAAMAETRGRLWRPFLDVGRAAILAYAQTHQLRWIEDESNADTGFSRNYLRHEILGVLEQRFPHSTANLAAASRRFSEAQQLLDDLAFVDLGTHAAEFPLATEVLTRLTEPRARNVLRYLLQSRHIGIPSEERLREALRQLLAAAPDRHPAIAFGCFQLRRRGRQVFVEPDQEV